MGRGSSWIWATMIASALAGMAVVSQVSGATFYSYSIGNSLTVDANIGAVQQMAAARGKTAGMDQHIHTAYRLYTLFDNPTDTDVTPGFAGQYVNAFTNYTWNAITLEPYYAALGLGNGFLVGDGDTLAFVNFMSSAIQHNAANVNAQFYILARWPVQSSFSPGYTGEWNSAYAGDPDNGNSTATKDYFTQLLNAVRNQQTTNASLQGTKPIEMIPVGFVFADLDRQIGLNQLGSITSMSTFYRDDQHMSQLGSFVESLTMYATEFKDNPTGFAAQDFETNFSQNYPNINQALVNQIETTVWNVVTSLPVTGVPEPASAGLVMMMGLPWLLSRQRGRSTG